MSQDRSQISGVIAAVSTPIFLGMAPVFGKLALQAGTDPFSVAALRTMLAVVLLWSIYLVWFRRYIFIYPAGLIGCIVIGAINGIGSLFYYSGLGVLDASLVQLLNGMYLPLAVVLSWLGGQSLDRRTLLRVLMAMLALAMITGFGSSSIEWGGVGFMIGSALMFAGTLILSQYVLYEMPAPTVTLYTLSTMGVVVSMVWLAVGEPISQDVLELALPPIFLLGVSTALSRLAMFAGVKFLGGQQTAFLAITEIGVALTMAFAILGDRLTAMQWLGVGVLAVSLVLIRQKDFLPHGYNPNALVVANMASVQFQRIAFHRAFGTRELDNEMGTMTDLTASEMIAIQRMMGAQLGGIDPYPIGKSRRWNGQLDLLNGAPPPPPAEPEIMPQPTRSKTDE